MLRLGLKVKFVGSAGHGWARAATAGTLQARDMYG